MCRLGGVFHHACRPAYAPARTNVLQGREAAADYSLSRFNHSLRRLLVSHAAVGVPDGDGGYQRALRHTPVERGQDSRAEGSPLQPPQKVQPSVGLLYDAGRVGGPLEVAGDVQAQVFTGGDHLHSCSFPCQRQSP